MFFWTIVLLVISVLFKKGAGQLSCYECNNCEKIDIDIYEPEKCIPPKVEQMTSTTDPTTATDETTAPGDSTTGTDSTTTSSFTTTTDEFTSTSESTTTTEDVSSTTDQSSSTDEMSTTGPTTATDETTANADSTMGTDSTTTSSFTTTTDEFTSTSESTTTTGAVSSTTDRSSSTDETSTTDPTTATDETTATEDSTTATDSTTTSSFTTTTDEFTSTSESTTTTGAVSSTTDQNSSTDESSTTGPTTATSEPIDYLTTTILNINFNDYALLSRTITPERIVMKETITASNDLISRFNYTMENHSTSESPNNENEPPANGFKSIFDRIEPKIARKIRSTTNPATYSIDPVPVPRIFRYRRMLRAGEKDGTNRCFKIERVIANNVIVSRGCVDYIGSDAETCDTLKELESDENADQFKCHLCNSDNCNSSAYAYLSRIISFITVIFCFTRFAIVTHSVILV